MSFSSTFVRRDQVSPPVSREMGTLDALIFDPAIIADGHALRSSECYSQWVIDRESNTLLPRCHASIMIRPAQRFQLYIACPDLRDMPMGMRTVTGRFYRVTNEPSRTIVHRFNIPVTGNGLLRTAHMSDHMGIIEAPFVFPDARDPCWTDGSDGVQLRLDLSMTDSRGVEVLLSIFEWTCRAPVWDYPSRLPQQENQVQISVEEAERLLPADLMRLIIDGESADDADDEYEAESLKASWSYVEMEN